MDVAELTAAEIGRFALMVTINQWKGSVTEIACIDRRGKKTNRPLHLRSSLKKTKKQGDVSYVIVGHKKREREMNLGKRRSQ